MSKRRTTANDGYLKCHEDDSCECKLLALIFILVCVASAFLHSTSLEGGFDRNLGKKLSPLEYCI